MQDRFANVVYWLGCAVAVGWTILCVVAFNTASGGRGDQPWMPWAVWATIALPAWLIGRAMRYILSGR
jgi:hypothetical protein